MVVQMEIQFFLLVWFLIDEAVFLTMQIAIDQLVNFVTVPATEEFPIKAQLFAGQEEATEIVFITFGLSGEVVHGDVKIFRELTNFEEGWRPDAPFPVSNL